MPAYSMLSTTALPRRLMQRDGGRAGRQPPRVPGVLRPPYRNVLTAIDALDELVAALLQKNAGKIPRDFLDWVADDMTPRLEAMALEHFAAQGTPAADDTRAWVAAVCQRCLVQKLRGIDPGLRESAPEDPDFMPTEPAC